MPHLRVPDFLLYREPKLSLAVGDPQPVDSEHVLEGKPGGFRKVYKTPLLGSRPPDRDQEVTCELIGLLVTV